MKNFEKPVVSVVIATYNREKYIKRAIESVINQTYKNIELIIIDDGSTDNTGDVVKHYLADSRVRYIYQKNQGCIDARNNGVVIAKGKYIAILDSDDFWCDKNKIEKQVNFLEKNTEYVIVGGGAIQIDQNGKEVVRYLLPEKDIDIRKVLLVSDALAHVTVLFRRDAWEKVGGYDKKFGFEDWDLFLKMGKIGKLYNIQEFFASYSSHQRNDPGKNDKDYSRLKQMKLKINMKKEYRNDYPNYEKAILSCWIAYFYSLLPFRRELWPLLFKLRKLFFSRSLYR